MAAKNISVSTIVADFSKKRSEATIPEMTETEININKLKNENKNIFYSNIRNKKKIKNKHAEKEFSIMSRNRQNAVEKEILKAVRWEINPYGDEMKINSDSNSNNKELFCSKGKGCEKEKISEIDDVARRSSSTCDKNVRNMESKNFSPGSMDTRAILHSLLSNYPLQVYE